ncbi:MAG: 16S rRNA (cytosine(1402)-N(4))-methyltransferase RsmH [Lachnospiraceae bacterium]|nr:16S rRNA (cytosine(1402)-N(4))-methyltransferase RsmH [Lachnospiraceae bacterium]
MEFEHISVLQDETIEALRVNSKGVYADGTLGGGGHSYRICSLLGEGGRLYGFDVDPDAIAAASEKLKEFGDRATIIRSNFQYMVDELVKRGETGTDGIILDLGVSSHQLDDPARGFTYRADAPLDMRMSRDGGYSAADAVNTLSEDELVRIIRDYGEERYAGRIARRICQERQIKPIRTTGELAGAVRAAIPAKARQAAGHPAKRTFQAIRIHVNDELGVLERSLDGMIDFLNDGGRICVITFHSLEDRIVKNIFRKNEKPCTCPPDFPVCVCGKKSKGKVITGKPIVPGENEIRENNRAHSAKLRVFERRLT